ncbi:MAG: LacI family transcriptional regulator [Clostridiales bacterium]|jgi:LacI family transcriptional regulator|nr:LacI family transcriptional regulator [Clostridiales bacterium]MDN5299233.1 LacI family transcriptional regulator [Clostridiales bacterium]
MKSVNIKDIARIAGVGVATVSRVINHHPDVKEETRQHILKIIEEYNYIPNNSARYLKRSESNDIGIIIKGIYNPLFAEMMQKIERILSQVGYTVMLHHHMDMAIRDMDVAQEFVKEKRLKGLICLGGDFEDVQTDEVRQMGVPMILTSALQNSSLDRNVYSSVGIDNEVAAFEIVDYLCTVGHQKIGIITTGEHDQSIGGRRTQGYMRALATHDIPKVDERFEVGDYTFESAYLAMKRLLEKAPDLTAVFAISDIMAIGAARAIREVGKTIPEDIALAGFDDIDYAAFFNPPLTTVKQPLETLSETTAELMIALLEDRSEHEHMMLQTTLKIRKTT